MMSTYTYAAVTKDERNVADERFPTDSYPAYDALFYEQDFNIDCIFLSPEMTERSCIMSKLIECKKSPLILAAKADQESYPPRKGQRIIYEKEEAEIISVKPLFVIKTRKRVICGALQERCEYI